MRPFEDRGRAWNGGLRMIGVEDRRVASIFVEGQKAQYELQLFYA